MNKNLFLIVFISSVLLSCNDPEKTKENNSAPAKTKNINKDTEMGRGDKVQVANKEDSIFDEIIKIPEIVEFENLLNKKNRNLKMWILDTIQRDNKNYIIYNVGEDNGFALVGEYHFAREINNSKILAYDVIDDTILSLQTWRQKTNKKNQ